ncbi:MAG: bifunctional 4-hydroxy-2-oxoglutarate aldolase/2-dehydro-3-deoxy-phosphogluconate aldolase [Candidatus Merdousia sp.]|nr:bifunctional 4-hydroxy-2-oxoglutarate aldolase/2-dehydro-3-deoxy-phosphogluconate aldolase [Opitutae bacterium KCR 482]MDF3287110.1 bifunctional 4-hydroxy-2-oxoglutarate aldolase/2-dehydro-3-deoxy-phosphogluconate aldolase [Opitutae bacterium KCR 482]MDY5582356.1 bifunctional 4-hydroxy-2-oxoglutarate aldolase/2-dehydro-3-deoxy-phosphogluconate aldolase [Candidatus Merdousia sp.]
MKTLAEKVREARIVAVLSVNDKNDAVDLANALADGGIKAIELTLRTPNAFECASAIVEKAQKIMLGIGTVLTPEQAEEAKRRGADFAVSPGCNVRVIDAAQKAGLPFAPGIMTPSEIEQSLEHGCTLMKYFPAGTTGGMKHLESMAAPYKHLGVSFIPLGGLKLANMGEYLSSPLVAAIGGSWIAPAKLINERDWAAIRKNAEEATAALNA